VAVLPKGQEADEIRGSSKRIVQFADTGDQGESLISMTTRQRDSPNDKYGISMGDDDLSQP
jgi:hypothetical protein